MDKYIYDKSNGLWYELQGAYYIPCLTLAAEKESKSIGLWGQRHLRYLKEYRQKGGREKSLPPKNFSRKACL